MQERGSPSHPGHCKPGNHYIRGSVDPAVEADVLEEKEEEEKKKKKKKKKKKHGGNKRFLWCYLTNSATTQQNQILYLQENSLIRVPKIQYVACEHTCSNVDTISFFTLYVTLQAGDSVHEMQLNYVGTCLE